MIPWTLTKVLFAIINFLFTMYKAHGVNSFFLEYIHFQIESETFLWSFFHWKYIYSS